MVDRTSVVIDGFRLEVDILTAEKMCRDFLHRDAPRKKYHTGSKTIIVDWTKVTIFYHESIDEGEIDE